MKRFFRRSQRRSDLDPAMVEALLDLSQTLVSSSGHEERMTELCRYTIALMDCDRCSIFLKEGSGFRGHFNAGNPPSVDRGFRAHRVPRHDPLINEAFTRGEAVVLNDAVDNELMDQATAKRADINAIIVVPLYDGTQESGFITAEYNQRQQEFTDLQVTLMTGIARIVQTLVALAVREQRQTKLDHRISELQRFEPLGRLAGGLAHDFNNTLTVVLGYCDLIEVSRTVGKELDESLDAIRVASRRASNLARQLLIFAKGGQTNTTALDIVEVVLDLLPMITTLLPDTITLDTEVEVAEAWVRADRSEIDQVLMNLILNSRDSIEGAGEIVVRVRADGGSVELSVSDDGSGVPAELIESIFDPFFSTKESGGLGLGLANVKDIVERCGGQVSVSSNGDGSTFTVTLPLCEAAERPLDHRTEGVSEEPGSEIRLLLVDDHPAILKIQSHWLNRAGFDVVSTTDPQEAKRLLMDPTFSVDVLVSDMLMPRVSGSELLNVAAKAGVKRALIMSAYQGESSVDIDRRDIKVAFIQKPFPASELSAAILRLHRSN